LTDSSKAYDLGGEDGIEEVGVSANVVGDVMDNGICPLPLASIALVVLRERSREPIWHVHKSSLRAWPPSLAFMASICGGKVVVVRDSLLGVYVGCTYGVGVGETPEASAACAIGIRSDIGGRLWKEDCTAELFAPGLA
jgi:hypothetical protein